MCSLQGRGRGTAPLAWITGQTCDVIPVDAFNIALIIVCADTDLSNSLMILNFFTIFIMLNQYAEDFNSFYRVVYIFYVADLFKDLLNYGFVIF